MLKAVKYLYSILGKWYTFFIIICVSSFIYIFFFALFCGGITISEGNDYDTYFPHFYDILQKSTEYPYSEHIEEATKLKEEYDSKYFKVHNEYPTEKDYIRDKQSTTIDYSIANKYEGENLFADKEDEFIRIPKNLDGDTRQSIYL